MNSAIDIGIGRSKVKKQAGLRSPRDLQSTFWWLLFWRASEKIPYRLP